MSSRSPHSRITEEAVSLLGRRIALARRERRWTIVELAQRLGSSETTVRKVEQGNPTVALGTAFEAAALVGVRLFNEDDAVLAREAEVVDARLAVIPQRVRKRAVDDDF